MKSENLKILGKWNWGKIREFHLEMPRIVNTIDCRDQVMSQQYSWCSTFQCKIMQGLQQKNILKNNNLKCTDFELLFWCLDEPQNAWFAVRGIPWACPQIALTLLRTSGLAISWFGKSAKNLVISKLIHRGNPDSCRNLILTK
jgi:hypothetical protein